MRRIGLTALILALGLGVAACAQSPSGIVHPANDGEMSAHELGAELYAANCASCHGITGGGVNADQPLHGYGDIESAGPQLSGTGARAVDFYLRTGRMPLSRPGEVPERSRPAFSPREISALTAYVDSLGGGPPIPRPEPSRENLARGMDLFTDRCAGCHQVVGEGGYLPDTTAPVLSHASAVEIAEAVRIGPYLMPTFSKRAISNGELNSIIAYVEASKHPDDRGGLGIGHVGPVPEGIVAWLVAALGLIGICLLIGERVRQ